DAQRAAVDAYVEQTRRETEIERLATDKEKTGVFLGAYAVNPFTEQEIPIYIADYVLATYGTGAIMAVPGGDERDYDFALKHGLSIVPVVAPPAGAAVTYLPEGELAGDQTGAGPVVKGTRANPLLYTGPGTMINSGPLDGM